MSDSESYRDVIEAIGMLASRSTVSNKLNKIFTHTKDIQLQAMVGNLLHDIPIKGINTKIVSIRDSSQIRTKEIEAYCRIKIEMDIHQKPISKT